MVEPDGPNPWVVAVGDEAHTLQARAEAAVGDALGPHPEVLAKCGHCDDIVVVLWDGTWAIVDLSTHTSQDLGQASSRIRHFSTVTEVVDAMHSHA